MEWLKNIKFFFVWLIKINVLLCDILKDILYLMINELYVYLVVILFGINWKFLLIDI